MTYRLTSAYIHPVMSWTKVATASSRDILMDYIKDDPDPNKVWRISRSSVMPRLYIHYSQQLCQVGPRRQKGVMTDWLHAYESENRGNHLFQMCCRAMSQELMVTIGREILLEVPHRPGIPVTIDRWLKNPIPENGVQALQDLSLYTISRGWLAAVVQMNTLTTVGITNFRANLMAEETLSRAQVDRVMCNVIRRHITPDVLFRHVITIPHILLPLYT